jgi:hypothetical protein
MDWLAAVETGADWEVSPKATAAIWSKRPFQTEVIAN